MVAALSRKKKSQVTHVDKLSDALEAMRRVADELTEAIDRDAASYDAVMAALKLPQVTPEELKAREVAVQASTRGAAEVPMQVAERTVALYERLGQLASISAASMTSDLEVAKLMAAAGAKGALANVEINLEGVSDAGYVTPMRERIAALRQRVGETSRTSSA
jgi:formiminotetrahydrofolate cyclodeaminase